MNRRTALIGIAALAAGVVAAPAEALTFPLDGRQEWSAISIGVDCAEGLSDFSAVFLIFERQVYQQMMLPAWMLEAPKGEIPTIHISSDGWPVSGEIKISTAAQKPVE